jgi:hypothetical protein
MERFISKQPGSDFKRSLMRVARMVLLNEGGV